VICCASTAACWRTMIHGGYVYRARQTNRLPMTVNLASSYPGMCQS
tara:strand:+ start:101259 stop:101396 length:138 start_codon:yes stop_codon:yes gene_type:complete